MRVQNSHHIRYLKTKPKKSKQTNKKHQSFNPRSRSPPPWDPWICRLQSSQEGADVTTPEPNIWKPLLEQLSLLLFPEMFRYQAEPPPFSVFLPSHTARPERSCWHGCLGTARPPTMLARKTQANPSATQAPTAGLGEAGGPGYRCLGARQLEEPAVLLWERKRGKEHLVICPFEQHTLSPTLCAWCQGNSKARAVEGPSPTGYNHMHRAHLLPGAAATAYNT